GREVGADGGADRVDRDGQVGLREAPLLEELRIPDVDVAVDQREALEARADGHGDRRLYAAVENLQSLKQIRKAAVGVFRQRLWNRLRPAARRRMRGRRVAEIDLPVVGANEGDVGL